MPMPSYPVLCYAPDCGAEAEFKIAARWSDGVTGELKTYFLACTACLPSLFEQAKIKRDRCTLAAGESLDVPSIFRMSRGARDRQLVRCEDLEKQLSAG